MKLLSAVNHFTACLITSQFRRQSHGEQVSAAGTSIHSQALESQEGGRRRRKHTGQRSSIEQASGSQHQEHHPEGLTRRVDLRPGVSATISVTGRRNESTRRTTSTWTHWSASTGSEKSSGLDWSSTRTRGSVSTNKDTGVKGEKSGCSLCSDCRTVSVGRLCEGPMFRSTPVTEMSAASRRPDNC